MNFPAKRRSLGTEREFPLLEADEFNLLAWLSIFFWVWKMGTYFTAATD